MGREVYKNIRCPLRFTLKFGLLVLWLEDAMGSDINLYWLSLGLKCREWLSGPRLMLGVRVRSFYSMGRWEEVWCYSESYKPLAMSINMATQV